MTHRIPPRLLACGTLCLLTQVSAAPAAGLSNGSFEQPVVADGAALQITPSGWAWAGGIGFVINPSPGTLAAQDGQQYADIGNTSAFALRQDFSIDVAGRYRLSWFDNAAAFAQLAPYRVSFAGLAPVDFDANEGVDGLWNARTLDADLAVGNYTLLFAPNDIAGPLPAQDRLLDGVTLTTVVPLPPAVALFAVAGLGLTGRLRRR